jgi:hypothetical protein
MIWYEVVYGVSSTGFDKSSWKITPFFFFFFFFSTVTRPQFFLVKTKA